MSLPPAADATTGPSESASRASRSTARRWQWVAIVFLAVLPVLPTVRASFIYDDTTIIRDNAILRGWASLARVWTSSYWPAEGGPDKLGLYRPLHMGLLATIWNASHGSALAFHLYAIALAALSCVCVWWMLRRGVSAVPAFVAAAWFATHPLHVEAVASVANTSELLVLLATVAMARLVATGAPEAAEVPSGGAQPLLIALVAAAALLSKESGLLALPVAGLTAWGWRAPGDGHPGFVTLARANARAIAAGLVAIVLALIARATVLGTPVAPSSIAAQGIDGMPATQRMVAMLSLWPRLAAMLAWPHSLAPYYGPGIFPSHRSALAILSIVVTIATVGLAVAIARRGDRRPLVALSWIALTYLPASNLLTPTGQVISDRTLFGATVGAALAIGWLIERLPRPGRSAAIAVIAIALSRDALVSVRYAIDWTSHRALWSRIIAVEPAEHLGYKLLGMDARARGDSARAIQLLGHALALAPSDRQARFELAQALYSAGRYGEASATVAPLMHDADAQGEPALVALYLDAVGRSEGARAVIVAAALLAGSRSATVAALFAGVAHERLGELSAAESTYVAGLRTTPKDTALVARLSAVRARMVH